MPFDVYTKLLLHCDGADGSIIFIDEIGHTVTAHSGGGIDGGGATNTMAIDTAQSMFGGASANFTDGNSDALSFPGTDFALGTGDFVIDCRVRQPSLEDETCMVSFRGTSNSVPTNIWFGFFAGFLLLRYGGSEVGAAAPVVADTWHHAALVRSSGVTRMFLDGVHIGGNYADANDYTAPPQVMIGGELAPHNGMRGWLDEIRISVGTDRGWASGFTPPTEAYAPEIVIPPEPEVPPTALPGGGSGRWTEEVRRPQRIYTEEELREIEEARRIREETKREREIEIRQAVERAFAELTGEPLPADISADQDIPPAVPSEGVTARRLDSDLVRLRNVEALDRILDRLAVQFNAIEQADIEYRLAQRLAAIEEDEIATLLLLEA